MDLAGLAAQCGVTPNADGAIDTQCLKCGGKALLWVAQTTGKLWARCEDQCGKLDPETLLEALADDFAARQALLEPKPKPESKIFASKPLASTNGGTNGHIVRLDDAAVQRELSVDYEFSFLVKQWAETAGFRAIYPTNEEFNPKLVEQVYFWIRNGKVSGYEHLTEAQMLAKAQEFADGYAPIKRREALSLLISENAEQAIVSNAEYLSRDALIDRLYYSQHISLGVGGKHEGKTTNVRTEALSIATEKKIYGRDTKQTYVIYAASDDEYPTTRMELLRMGWNPSVPLELVKIRTGEGFNPERVLEELATLAIQRDSRFIVLDMLFDFVRIADEIKYAHTREAIGHIQVLADAIKGHVRSTHHSPKWMPDAATAAKAALGSQGIAARFSPILLSKQWAPDLFTIESTMTRDPRGLALPPTVIQRDETGWAQDAGEFKSWMKWRIYAERIKAVFEGGEANRKLTVAAVQEVLELSRQEVQSAMYQMTLGDKPILDREKGKGNSYKYFLYVDPWAKSV